MSELTPANPPTPGRFAALKQLLSRAKSRRASELHIHEQNPHPVLGGEPGRNDLGGSNWKKSADQHKPV